MHSFCTKGNYSIILFIFFTFLGHYCVLCERGSVRLLALQYLKEVPDDLVSDLYHKYKEAVTENNEQSLRRLFKKDKEYRIHVNKLKDVNGFKRHNLFIKEVEGDSNTRIYINNPVESKVPNAYLTLDEFRNALMKRGKMQREEYHGQNSRPVIILHGIIKKKQTRPAPNLLKHNYFKASVINIMRNTKVTSKERTYKKEPKGIKNKHSLAENGNTERTIMNNSSNSLSLNSDQLAVVTEPNSQVNTNTDNNPELLPTFNMNNQHDKLITMTQKTNPTYMDMIAEDKLMQSNEKNTSSQVIQNTTLVKMEKTIAGVETKDPPIAVENGETYVDPTKIVTSTLEESVSITNLSTTQNEEATSTPKETIETTATAERPETPNIDTNNDPIEISNIETNDTNIQKDEITVETSDKDDKEYNDKEPSVTPDTETRNEFVKESDTNNNDTGGKDENPETTIEETTTTTTPETTSRSTWRTLSRPAVFMMDRKR